MSNVSEASKVLLPSEICIYNECLLTLLGGSVGEIIRYIKIVLCNAKA